MPDIDINLDNENDIDIEVEVSSPQDVNINAQALYGPKGDKGDKGDQGIQGIQGIQGPQGDDGYSPVATVTKSGSVATITITDKNGTTTAQVSDGVGHITDVQQNGVSVVSSGVANVIVPDAQIQADWSQSDNTKKDYIKNKPTKLSDFTDDLGTSPIHTHSQYLTLQDISGKEDISNKGVANGYAGLDADGKVPKAQLPNTGIELCDIGMALYVDETKGLRRYLNGQIVDINTNAQVFLNRLLEIKNTNPDYFTTEENWQAEALLNIDGCVYKFVLNYSGDNVVSVRLPKYPDFVEINAGGTLPVVGNGMTLGLTNGTQLLGVYGTVSGISANTGSTYGSNIGSNSDSSGTTSADLKTVGITTDPTKSGIKTTLKQTKLKMRYFIQIATGSETENNIINDIELNNPYSLFDSKYSDHELNNLSWLKSSGQWNAKSFYTDAYDKLLKVYNGTETVEGLSVKLSTETYTDYDFVLNTADETFRLPLKTLHSDDTVDSLSLYFYVGETVQNANLIDAGRIGEHLANKLDHSAVKAYVTETYQNGTSWYRIYSDGWCEQGGTSLNEGRKQINLLKNFVNTNYNVLGTCLSSSSSSVGGWFVVDTKTVSSFYATIGYGGGAVSVNTNYTYVWQASGYIN